MSAHNTDTVPLTYPSEKNVSRHGAIAVGSSVRLTLKTEARLLGRGVPKVLVDALRAGGMVTQIITGTGKTWEWVSVRIRLLAPMDGANPYTTAAPDDLEPM
jgi:hypothetical protein